VTGLPPRIPWKRSDGLLARTRRPLEISMSMRISRDSRERGGSNVSTDERTPGPHSGATRSPTARMSQGADQTSIRVMVRVRPRLQTEVADRECITQGPGGQSVALSSGQGENRNFVVDQVFDSRTEQGSQIFVYTEFARDFVMQSLKGYNVCIFAYGHTGSGKTYTILGDNTECTQDVLHNGAGLLPRFIHEIFEAHAADAPASTAESQRKGLHYSCEFYEVYNEQIRDLLAPNNTERRRKVHVHPKHGVRIEGSAPSLVNSAEEALGLVNFGNQMRTVCSTTMNDRSSRSHAIITFKFEQLAAETPAPAAGEGGVGGTPTAHAALDPQASEISPRSTTGGSLNVRPVGGGSVSASPAGVCESTVTFVDLAGREEHAASCNRATHIREMCFINTSLFHLAHLINKLAEGQVEKGSLTDFRNSKLTLLLSQALIGNSKTALVATVAPLQSYFDDSLSTLMFAQSVKKIKTYAVVNNKGYRSVVSELEQEVRSLQKELCESKTNSAEKEQSLLAAEALIDHYQRTYDMAKERSEMLKSVRSSISLKLGLMDPSSCPNTPAAGSSGVEIPPFLTKLSDDPSLQGCCNYGLKKRSLYIGSDETTCDIVLQGLGIVPTMCEVKLSNSGGVLVEVTDAIDKMVTPRVLVNGEPLVPGTKPHRVKHGDCLILGYAHAFRLVAPSVEQSASCGTPSNVAVLARATIARLDMASAVAEVMDVSGVQFKTVYPYLQHLSTRVPESTVKSFLKVLHGICPLIDEANLITREVHGNDELHFELYTLANPFNFENQTPEFAVCVLSKAKSLSRCKHAAQPVVHERRSDLEGHGRLYCPHDNDRVGGKVKHPLLHALGLSEHMTVGGDELLYIWSLEKFLGRLNEIREIYHEGHEAGDNFGAIWQRLTKKQFLDPWKELSFADVRLLAEDMGQILRRVAGAEAPVMSWITQGLDTTASPSTRSGLHSSADLRRSESDVAAGAATPKAAAALAVPALWASGGGLATPTAAGGGGGGGFAFAEVVGTSAELSMSPMRDRPSSTFSAGWSSPERSRTGADGAGTAGVLRPTQWCSPPPLYPLTPSSPSSPPAPPTAPTVAAADADPSSSASSSSLRSSPEQGDALAARTSFSMERRQFALVFPASAAGAPAAACASSADAAAHVASCRRQDIDPSAAAGSPAAASTGVAAPAVARSPAPVPTHGGSSSPPLLVPAAAMEKRPVAANAKIQEERQVSWSPAPPCAHLVERGSAGDGGAPPVRLALPVGVWQQTPAIVPPQPGNRLPSKTAPVAEKSLDYVRCEIDELRRGLCGGLAALARPVAESQQSPQRLKGVASVPTSAALADSGGRLAELLDRFEMLINLLVPAVEVQAMAQGAMREPTYTWASMVVTPPAPTSARTYASQVNVSPSRGGSAKLPSGRPAVAATHHAGAASARTPSPGASLSICRAESPPRALFPGTAPSMQELLVPWPAAAASSPPRQACPGQRLDTTAAAAAVSPRSGRTSSPLLDALAAASPSVAATAAAVVPQRMTRCTSPSRTPRTRGSGAACSSHAQQPLSAAAAATTMKSSAATTPLRKSAPLGQSIGEKAKSPTRTIGHTTLGMRRSPRCAGGGSPWRSTLGSGGGGGRGSLGADGGSPPSSVASTAPTAAAPGSGGSGGGGGAAASSGTASATPHMGGGGEGGDGGGQSSLQPGAGGRGTQRTPPRTGTLPASLGADDAARGLHRWHAVPPSPLFHKR